MKNRITAILLCLMMLVCLFPSAAFAAARFTDITDKETLQATDILGMLGIVSESPEKLFYPDEPLTRAEFCTMAVKVMGADKLVPQYKNSSVFPDVRASHWASGYIGVAARSSYKFIAGYPDGTFCPDEPINYGEAITVLMRVLGFSDKDSGAVWPQGYIDLAKKQNVYVDGLGGKDTITRGQAAKLFIALICAEGDNSYKYYNNLGSVQSSKRTISSIDAGNGTVRFTNGTSLVLAHPLDASSLIGKIGTVILDSNGKMICFIPDSVDRSEAPGSVAAIAPKDGSTAGFDALSGGNSYTIYKNGVRIDASQIKKYDVATYDSVSSSIILCEDRVSTYYEDCTPSAKAPVQITVLGGTKLEVLASAQESLAAFKPGMSFTLLLTADGKVAGAINDSSVANMLAAVDLSGNISMICGGKLIPLSANQTAGENYCGNICRISSYAKNTINLSVRTEKATKALVIKENTANGKALAGNVLIFEDGTLVSSKEDIAKNIAPVNIRFLRSNSADQVDIINYSNAGTERVVAGRSVIEKHYYPTAVDGVFDIEEELFIVFGDGADDNVTGIYFDQVSDGVYVKANYRDGKSYDKMTDIVELSKLVKVTKTSWIGQSAVNYGGLTYELSDAACIYNTDTKSWEDNIDDAFAYADEFTLYAYDGVVYAMEINAVVIQ